jgi:hypothetical protein
MEEVVKPIKKEFIQVLDQMIENTQNLPATAMLTPVNQYDFLALMMIVSSLAKAE